MHEDILVLDDQIMSLSATSFRSRTTFTGNVHSTLPKQIHVSRCALTPSSGCGQLCHWCFITSSELGIIQELLIEPTRTCIVYNGIINSLGWVFRIYYVGVNVA